MYTLFYGPKYKDLNYLIMGLTHIPYIWRLSEIDWANVLGIMGYACMLIVQKKTGILLILGFQLPAPPHFIQLGSCQSYKHYPVHSVLYFLGLLGDFIIVPQTTVPQTVQKSRINAMEPVWLHPSPRRAFYISCLISWALPHRSLPISHPIFI